jgi:predicted permease
MKQDLLLALRSIWKSPFLSLAVVLSLALGIGANTAIFSLMDQMLLRSLPVENPEALVFLEATGPKSGRSSTNGAGGGDAVFSYPFSRDLIAKQTALEGVAGYRELGANLAYAGTTVSGSLEAVTGNYFDVLQVRGGMGRMLTPEDDTKREPVAVLSHAYWANRLGADPSVINQKMVVNGVPFTIAGIAPKGFIGTTTGDSPDLWVPMSLKPQLTPNWDGTGDRRDWWVYLVGRLKSGDSAERARTELQTLLSALLADEVQGFANVDEDFRKRYAASSLRLVEGAGGRSSERDEASTPLIALMITTLMVLLIACANVANLQLVRASNRLKDIAVRVAMGAGRWPVFRQMLTESMVLGVLGSLAGLVVGKVALQLLLGVIVNDDAPQGALTADLDSRVLLFTLALGMLTGLVFGTYPAWRASSVAVANTLKDQAGQVLSAGASRIRKGLVIAQMAVSLMLLVAAGLFTRSLVNLSKVDLGFPTENLIVFGLSPELNGYKPADVRAIADRTVAELRALPGVTGAAISEVPLLGGSRWSTNVTVEGYTPGKDEPNPWFAAVGPGLFTTAGIRLREGREFTAADVSGAPKVALVNEAFERHYFGGKSALGRRMATGGGDDVKPDMEIIGVVRDSRYASVKEDTRPVFYAPQAQRESINSFFVYVRTALPEASMISQIRRTMAVIDRNLPLDPLRTMREQAERSTHVERVIVKLSATFALLATLLAIVGLYGVMAYSVASRTREIGIRMAFGASPGPIQGMVLGEATKVLLVGAALGLAAAFWLTRYVESLLFGLGAGDPPVYISATIAILAAGLMAALMPARRASRVDPMTCLRYE